MQVQQDEEEENEEEEDEEEQQQRPIPSPLRRADRLVRVFHRPNIRAVWHVRSI